MFETLCFSTFRGELKDLETCSLRHIYPRIYVILEMCLGSLSPGALFAKEGEEHEPVHSTRPACLYTHLFTSPTTPDTSMALEINTVQRAALKKRRQELKGVSKVRFPTSLRSTSMGSDSKSFLHNVANQCSLLMPVGLCVGLVCYFEGTEKLHCYTSSTPTT